MEWGQIQRYTCTDLITEFHGLLRMKFRLIEMLVQPIYFKIKEKELKHFSTVGTIVRSSELQLQQCECWLLIATG